MKNLLYVVARFAFSLVFMFEGWIKITGAENWIGFLNDGMIPAAGLVLFVVILAELGGGMMLLFGLQTGKTVLLLLVLMVVETTVSLVAGVPDSVFMTGASLIFRNVAIMGGLLNLYLHAPGKGSVEAPDSMSNICRKSLINSHIRIG